jgi:phospholipase C
MPETAGYAALDAASKQLPQATAPDKPAPLFQEKGTRFSRALPYRLKVHLLAVREENKVRLVFENNGKAGAVYHVYDLHHLDRIPRRYTVEEGKSLTDYWFGDDQGAYDLEIYGPNGYFWKFSGNVQYRELDTVLDYDHRKGGLSVSVHNPGDDAAEITIISNAYEYGGPWPLQIRAKKHIKKNWLLAGSGNWYDFSVRNGDGYLRRFAGRIETGMHSISDPAMAGGHSAFNK